ncbi:hypothetical protein KIN20_019276 [Parelaphostrongylus tenuis]|uniref:Uncharacterized protein n=1 Tax=Parelaphostrongylus tenuis TaxID=148309 RepID=A0AAD5ML54_PARTN|nr:hypothetical protein KIN20_019276 [Parelaphostrongylus tenuis]
MWASSHDDIYKICIKKEALAGAQPVPMIYVASVQLPNLPPLMYQISFSSLVVN